MSKLKPCPFCGATGLLHSREYWPDCARKPTMYYSIGCQTEDCYCELDDDYHESQDEAIKQWNKRTDNKVNPACACDKESRKTYFQPIEYCKHCKKPITQG